MYSDLGPTTHSTSSSTASHVKRDPGASTLLFSPLLSSSPLFSSPLFSFLLPSSHSQTSPTHMLSYHPLVMHLIVISFTFIVEQYFLAISLMLAGYLQYFHIVPNYLSFSGCTSCWSMCSPEIKRGGHLHISSYRRHAHNY